MPQLSFKSNRFRLILANLALLSGLLSLQATAQNEQKPAAAPLPTGAPLFKIADPAINELSGFAASRAYPGLLWGNNDSGDTARLFLINQEGKTVATVNFEGIDARDWEDIAAAGDSLYVGDMGDNLSVMENIKIHRIREPKLDPQKLGQNITIASNNIETATVTYPDGPHDAESLSVAPDGSILIVSKSTSGSNFYISQNVFRRGAIPLKKIGETFHFGGEGIFTKLATSGDLSPDGKKLLVGTYSQLYEFPLTRAYDFNSVDSKNAKTQDLPTLKQSESACYDLDGKQIFVSSEKPNPPVYALNSLLN